MNRRKSSLIRAVATLTCLSASAVIATDAAVETVLTALEHPSGVAVRPGGSPEQYEVFVSDSFGGRIVKVRSDQTDSGSDVITGFTRSASPKALLFLDRDHLVVSCSGQPIVRVYKLADEARAVAADNTAQAINEPAVETILSFARTRQNDQVPDMLVVACIADRYSDALAKVPIRAGTLDKLTALVGTEPFVRVLSRCVAVDSQGHVAVGQSDTSVEPHQHRLAFYDPIVEKAVVAIPVPLNDFMALAYHPTNDQLYALEFGPESKQGGLYRLDDASDRAKPGCKAVRITAIDFATALAFAPDGTLYVTSAYQSGGESQKTGALLQVRGKL